MKVSPDLYWLIPYITISKKFVDIKKITHLTCLKCCPSMKRKERVHGHTWIINEGESFKICVYTEAMSCISIPKGTWKIVKLKKQHILHTLAHEISHMEYDDHTPERMVLECKLMISFMKLLKKEGYISEEISE